MRFIATIFGLLVIGCCLFYLNQSPTKPSVSQTVVPSGTWHNFRGDSSLTGQTTKLSAKYKLLWTKKFETSFSAAPVLSQQLIIIGDDDGVLRALSRRDGELVWQFNGDNGFSAPPLINDETIFIGNLSGTFYALSLKSGKLIWKKEFGEQIYGSANLHENLLFFGCYDFNLHALDMKTGEEKWQVKTKNYVNGSPAVWQNRVAFGGCDAKLRIVESGQEYWTFEADSYLPSSPIFVDNKIYVGSHKGVIHGLDTTTKRQMWLFNSPEKEAFIAPLAQNGSNLVAVDDHGNGYILDTESGKLQQQFKLAGDVKAAPIIDAHKSLICDAAGTISIVDLATGKISWEYLSGPAISATPAVADGSLVVVDEEGNIFMFGGTK